MSTQHPTLLYVGPMDQAATWMGEAYERGMTVFVAQELYEALGMFITYLPDVVVLDTIYAPVLATEATVHLITVTHDDTPLVRLMPVTTPTSQHERIFELPYPETASDLLDVVSEIARTRTGAMA